MVIQKNELSQGKPSFPVLPTPSFSSGWLFSSGRYSAVRRRNLLPLRENFFAAASSGSDGVQAPPTLPSVGYSRWQQSIKSTVKNLTINP
jgi:hypothetical protein